MKTLSATQETRRTGTAWSVIWLVHLIVDGTTSYYSTRALTLSGNDYSPILLSPGSSSRTLGRERYPSGIIDGTIIRFANHNRDIETLWNAETGGLVGATAEIGFLFGPAAGEDADDIIWIAGKYEVDDFLVQPESLTCDLICVDPMLSRGELPVGLIINRHMFPEADFESYGQMAPIVFGQCKDCKLLPVAVGYQSTLKGSLEPNERIITVEAITDFPSSGTVQIGDEKIYYPIKNTGNKTLGQIGSLCDRGFDGTTEITHADNSFVTEVRADGYDFLVASHPVNDVTNVRAEGHPIDSGDYSESTISKTPQGSTNTQHVTVLSFPSLPTIQRTSAWTTQIEVAHDGLVGTIQEFDWVDNASVVDNTNGAQKTIETDNTRDGAVLAGTNNSLRVRLATNLKTKNLGDLIKARVRVMYFTRTDKTSGATIKIIRTATTIRSVPLNAALPQEHDVGDLGLHAHNVVATNITRNIATTAIAQQDVVFTSASGDDLSANFFSDTATKSVGSAVVFPDGIANIENLPGNNLLQLTTFTGYSGSGSSAIKAAAVFNTILRPGQGELLGITVKVSARYIGPGSTPKARLSMSLYIDGVFIVPIVGSSNPTPPTTTTILSYDVANVGSAGRDWSALESGAEIRLHLNKAGVSGPVDHAQVEIGGAWLTTTYASDPLPVANIPEHDGDTDVVIELESPEKTLETKLEAIAGSSSLATQTVNITPYLPDDPWDAFTGKFKVTVEANRIDLGDEIFITGVWLDLEVKQNETVTTVLTSITADINGLERNDSGQPDFRYPSEILRRVLLSQHSSVNTSGSDLGFLDLPASDIDSTTFDTALVKYRGSGMSETLFNRRIGEPLSTQELIEQVEQDARCSLFWEDKKLKIKVMELNEETANPFVLDSSNVLRVLDKSYAPNTALINQVDMSYNEDYDRPVGTSTAYDANVTGVSQESQDAFGERVWKRSARWMHNQEDNSEAPLETANFWANRLAFKDLYVLLEASPIAIHLERHDPVLLVLPNHNLNFSLGVVYQIRISSLNKIVMVVKIMGTATPTILYSLTSTTYVLLTPDERIIVYNNGIPTMSIDSDGNFKTGIFVSGTRAAGHASGVGDIEEVTHDVPNDAILFHYNYNGNADSKIWLVTTEAAGPIGQVFAEKPSVWFSARGTVRTNQDLSGDGAKATPIWDGISNGGSVGVWFTLKGNVVAKFIPSNPGSFGGTFSLAGRLMTNVEVGGI